MLDFAASLVVRPVEGFSTATAIVRIDEFVNPREKRPPVPAVRSLTPRREYKSEGYCYLRRFPRRARKTIGKALGPYPLEFSVFLLWRLLGSPRMRHLVREPGDIVHYMSVETLLIVLPHHRDFHPSSSPVGAPRAAFSGALDLLSQTVHRDAVVDPYATSTIGALNQSHRLCPNAITGPNFDKLLEAGYPVDPNAVGSHPHPAHKAIEEGMLAKVAQLVSSPTTVLFSKRAKFNRLSAANPAFRDLLNPVLTARDVARYGGSFKSWPVSVNTPTVFSA